MRLENLFRFILFIIIGCSSTYACAVCYGAQDSNMMYGSAIGGMVLISFTTMVLCFFVYLILYLRRKSDQYGKIKMNGKHHR